MTTIRHPHRRTVIAGLGAIAAFPYIRRANAADAIEQSTIEIAGVRDPQLGAQLARIWCIIGA